MRGGARTAIVAMTAASSLTVVIPTWREAARVTAAVRAARAIGDEVIVADAGSPDGTAGLAETAGARVVTSARSRGAQLHAGALAARGEVLLFLHADTDLAPEARAAIDEVLADPRVVGGNFDLEFVPDSFAARVFTRANRVRRRFFSIYYGDSAIFVRRRVYEELGGFKPLPILEDYELVRRLERHGATAYVRDVVARTSARRFEASPLRTLATWTWIQTLYSVFQVSPDRLAVHYRAIREKGTDA